MCDGRSSASWTMSSARSVSTASMPAAARASLSPISWVAMDLIFTTLSAPSARTRPATTAFAAAPSTARCTTPPANGGQAGRAARGRVLRPGGRPPVALVGQQGPGDGRVLQGEGTAEAAARTLVGQLDQVEPGHRPEQPMWTVTQPQQPQPVAG